MIRPSLAKASIGVAILAAVACSKGADASRTGVAPAVGSTAPSAQPGVTAPTAPGAATGSVRTPSSIAATGCPATDAANAVLPGTVHNDGIDAAETLTLAGSPHRFPDGVNIHENATLTVEPCARIIVGDGNTLRIERGGTLIANGTQDRPIRFESGSQTPARGVWSGILFLNGGRAGSTLKYAIIDGAGTSGEDHGALTLEDGVSVDLEHVRIVRSGRHGIRLNAGARFAAGSTDITVSESGVEHELSAAIYAYDANSVGSIPDVHFQGNVLNEVVVENAELDATATWRNLGPGNRYRLLNGLRVGGQTGPVLTIEAGTTLAFAQGMSLAVGFGADGAIVLDGAADATRIVLTSARPVPGPGDWGGVILGENLARAATKLSFVTIDFAGGTDANDDGGCHENAPAAVAILGRDLGAHLDHVRVTNLDAQSVAIARAYSGNAPTDYAAAALGNELAGGGRCKQTLPRDANGNCPDPVPACR